MWKPRQTHGTIRLAGIRTLKRRERRAPTGLQTGAVSSDAPARKICQTLGLKYFKNSLTFSGMGRLSWWAEFEPFAVRLGLAERFCS
jgi:hypothetical protein